MIPCMNGHWRARRSTVEDLGRLIEHVAEGRGCGDADAPIGLWTVRHLEARDGVRAYNCRGHQVQLVRSAAGRLRIVVVTAVVVAGLGAGCARSNPTDDALVAAIQHGEFAEAARLVEEEGADVNARTRQSRTPALSLASVHDFSGETTDLLLRHGADIEVED
jgi:hypothetical protein